MSDSVTVLAPTVALHLSEQVATSPHATTAYKLVIPIQGRIGLQRTAGGVEELLDRPVLVAPDVHHGMRGDGLCLALFVPPQAAEGRRLGLNHAAPFATVEGAAAVRLREIARAHHDELLTTDAPHDLLTTSLAAMALPDTPAPLDRRVRAVLEALEAPTGALDLDALARAAGLSRFHLSRLFSQQVGVPMQRYALWQKLTVGLGAVMAGASFTEAAHGAGFSDHAHFTRTMRRMLGHPPTYARENRSNIVQDPPPRPR